MAAGFAAGVWLATAIQACCLEPPVINVQPGTYVRADPIDDLDIAGGATLVVDADQVVLRYVSLSTGDEVTVTYDVVDKAMLD